MALAALGAAAAAGIVLWPDPDGQPGVFLLGRLVGRRDDRPVPDRDPRAHNPNGINVLPVVGVVGVDGENGLQTAVTCSW